MWVSEEQALCFCFEIFEIPNRLYSVFLEVLARDVLKRTITFIP